MKNNNSSGCFIALIITVMLALLSIALFCGCSRTNTSNSVESAFDSMLQYNDAADTACHNGMTTVTIIKSFVGADKAADFVDECYAKFGGRIVNVSMASNDYIRANMLVIMVTVETDTYGKDTR